MRPLNLAVLALLLALAACGAPPVAYDRASGRVQTIGLLTPSMPERATVFVWGSPGRMFGLVGALAEAAAQSAREDRVMAAIAPQGFAARTIFAQALATALEAEGYRVVPVEAGRPKKDFLDSYNGLPAQADAWLDCSFVEWGYLAAGGGNETPYRPYLNVTCRLVRAADGAVLMRDRVIYNWFLANPPPNQVVTIPPDPIYAFPTSDDIVADPLKAIQGMATAFRAAAAAVAVMLK